MTPITPIPITEDERSDEAFKRLCSHLFGSSDAYWTDVNGIIFDPYSVGDASPDDHPPYGCAYVDGSIGLRDSISFTSHWEEKRPTPLKINLPGLWKLLSRALRAAEEWPRLDGRYTGPLEVHLSLGNMNNTVVVYPHDRPDPPRTLNRASSWDASRFEWRQGQDVNDLLEQHLASLARLLQFGAYPSFKHSIRREATE